tara:strand:- start:646 stop:987 length:342 start_codon:yes stop_codon:yes gene_type:complete
VALVAVKKCGQAFDHVNAAIREDVGVILAALQQSSEVFEDAFECQEELVTRDTFLEGWAYLTKRAHRNRRAREAFLAKFGERNARVQAHVDLWLIQNGLTHYISAKRQRVSHC